MSNDPDFHPQVHPTQSGDGERSSAGSNYGDWRPNRSHGPHGYDFEARFKADGDGDQHFDADYRRLRDEHQRDLDAHYPHWQAARYQRFSQDFDRWRAERRGATEGQAEGQGQDGGADGHGGPDGPDSPAR